MPIFFDDQPNDVRDNSQNSKDETSYACKMSCEGNPIGKDDFTIKGTKSDKDPGLTEKGIIDFAPFQKELDDRTASPDQNFKDKIGPNEDSLSLGCPFEKPWPDEQSNGFKKLLPDDMPKDFEKPWPDEKSKDFKKLLPDDVPKDFEKPWPDKKSKDFKKLLPDEKPETYKNDPSLRPVILLNEKASEGVAGGIGIVGGISGNAFEGKRQVKER